MNISAARRNLCVLTPMYGNMATRNFVQSFIQLMLACMEQKIGFGFIFLGNESLIPRARNRLVDSFLKETKHAFSVFIDADIGFDAQDVLRMMELDRDIVGAGCPKKSLRLERIQKAVQRANGKELTVAQMERLVGDFVFNLDPFEGKRTIDVRVPIEVRNLGTGLLMVKRTVFQNFMNKYPERWYESRGDAASLPGPIHDFFRTGINLETRDYDSEDYWFCQDCKAIGYKVLLAPWVKTTHAGSYEFRADFEAVANLVGEF